VQQHAATFSAKAEDAAAADLPQFVEDEFEAFLKCGIPARGFLRVRCGDCGRDKLDAFRCKRRGFCPNSAARMARPRGPETLVAALVKRVNDAGLGQILWLTRPS